MIVTVALVIAPAIILREVGTFAVILKVSFSSTTRSLITVMFIVLLLVPAVIVAVCAIELKSTLPPKMRIEIFHTELHEMLVSYVIFS